MSTVCCNDSNRNSAGISVMPMYMSGMRDKLCTSVAGSGVRRASVRFGVICVGAEVGLVIRILNFP